MQMTVRLNPGKFWSATRSMSDEEREKLLATLSKLAEIGDYEGLLHFDFISIDQKAVA